MARQDTLMKALMRALSDGALDVFGVRGVELREPLPTELPANTLRNDKAWRMRDGRILHLEFQSTREPALYRFLEYDARLARAYQTDVRTVVMYHGGVTNAPEELSIGVALYRVENVYLSKLDGDEALDAVERHLSAGAWEPGDRLRLALAMNMRVRDETRAFERLLALIPAVPDEAERDLVISAILALGDQTLEEAQRARLREELKKVSKIVEELYQEGRQEGFQIGRIEGARLKSIQIAEELFHRGTPVKDVAEITGLSEQEAEEVRRRVMS
ncbi:hypothetical protein GCM10010885_12530 [Alicyclobacillus cellulosilyticus]|uniref:Uncharacterized protein n=1 Tax=Alicyclobacillus cellulosilyticus TaxID=1003997 RepID=A0A917KA24_9BACL|nr:hypothetical protein GCM10010885_12530 [Alicyclobacillus cellulosilyticus]